MAYLGLRQFKKAQQLLEHVLIAPSSNVANGLMLEAYKKWVLVNCLVNPTVWKQLMGNVISDLYRMQLFRGQSTQTRSSTSNQHPRHMRP
jgi:hypothetical protein